jgi:hypothetical protein
MHLGQAIDTFWEGGQVLGAQVDALITSIEQLYAVEANIEVVTPGGEEAQLEDDWME